jgi:hypothetical protein
VGSTLERELEAAQEGLTQALSEIASLGPDGLLDAPGLALLKDEDADLASAIESWAKAAASRLLGLQEGRAAPALPPSRSAAVRELAAARIRSSTPSVVESPKETLVLFFATGCRSSPTGRRRSARSAHSNEPRRISTRRR